MAKDTSNCKSLMDLIETLKYMGWELKRQEDFLVAINTNSLFNSMVFVSMEEDETNEDLDYNIFMDDLFFEMGIEETMRELRNKYSWQELNGLIQLDYEQAKGVKKIIAQWYNEL